MLLFIRAWKSSQIKAVSVHHWAFIFRHWLISYFVSEKNLLLVPLDIGRAAEKMNKNKSSKSLSFDHFNIGKPLLTHLFINYRLQQK
jgi:hypothetical protein